MTVTLHTPTDRETLQRHVEKEPNATQRDRYRAVLLAAEQKMGGDEIARHVGRSPRFVDKWVERYRGRGLTGLRPGKRPGKKPKLNEQQVCQLQAHLDAGPGAQDDGICCFHGKDICRLIEREFGVVHTVGGIYDVLKRIGYSSLKPRPYHPQNDVQAMEQFKADAPFLSRK